MRFGAEELFKEGNDEEVKSKLENMDIDEILARAEKVERKASDADCTDNELLSAFKASASQSLFLFSFCSAKLWMARHKRRG